MIEIKSVYKSFEDRNVLDDISFTFENGKTNLIIGQSGSGKTVLMKCLVGLLTPEKGEVLYDGHDFPKCSPLRFAFRAGKRDVSARYVLE